MGATIISSVTTRTTTQIYLKFFIKSPIESYDVLV
jgi:hypothetical protein